MGKESVVTGRVGGVGKEEKRKCAWGKQGIGCRRYGNGGRKGKVVEAGGGSRGRYWDWGRRGGGRVEGIHAIIN